MRRDTRDEVVTRGVERSAWRIDPDRSRVEFQVGHLYGLMTVRGRFSVYSGTLDLSADPAVELTIDANSLDTSTGDSYERVNQPRESTARGERGITRIA